MRSTRLPNSYSGPKSCSAFRSSSRYSLQCLAKFSGPTSRRSRVISLCFSPSNDLIHVRTSSGSWSIKVCTTAKHSSIAVPAGSSRPAHGGRTAPCRSSKFVRTTLSSQCLIKASRTKQDILQPFPNPLRTQRLLAKAFMGSKSVNDGIHDLFGERR